MVAVVAVIIIMNTLVISITERIGEIGTMRAIGARRSFVRGMITFETLIISLVFGLAGAAVGCAALAALGARGIETSSVFLQVLFGGPVLKPVIDPASVALSLLVIPAIGLLASLYPVSVALRIEPVKAMGQR
jgi:putative ABC transport system permease protein